MKNIFKRLHSNEDGVAMTEFVITLPLFVTAFIAIAAISNLLRDGTESIRFVSEDLWNQTMAIQTEQEYGRFTKPISGPIHNNASARVYELAGGAWEADLILFNQLNTGHRSTKNEEKTGRNLLDGGDFGELYGRLDLILDGSSGYTIVMQNQPKERITARGEELFESGGGKSDTISNIYSRLIDLVKDLVNNNRYGVMVGGTDIDGKNFYGGYKASWYSTSLVAPTGTGFGGPEATGIAMGGYLHLLENPYKDLLGLDESSELDRYDNKEPNPW